MRITPSLAMGLPLNSVKSVASVSCRRDDPALPELFPPAQGPAQVEAGNGALGETQAHRTGQAAFHGGNAVAPCGQRGSEIPLAAQARPAGHVHEHRFGLYVREFSVQREHRHIGVASRTAAAVSRPSYSAAVTGSACNTPSLELRRILKPSRRAFETTSLSMPHFAIQVRSGKREQCCAISACLPRL